MTLWPRIPRPESPPEPPPGQGLTGIPPVVPSPAEDDARQQQEAREWADEKARRDGLEWAAKHPAGKDW